MRRASRVIVHESYRSAAEGDDIALLALTGRSRTPGCNCSRRGSTTVFGPPGACAVVTGWGDTQGRSRLPDRLQAVDLPVVDSAECARVYPGMISAGQVCAGYRQGTRDSCQGDSGGPLVVPGGADGLDPARRRELGQGLRRAERLWRVHAGVALHRLDSGAHVAVRRGRLPECHRARRR